MSGQRSDWRERLHANPSRMEQELAIKLLDDQTRYLTQVEIPFRVGVSLKRSRIFLDTNWGLPPKFG